MEQRGSVLVCDDDAGFCSIVRRMLEGDGWTVIAETGVAIDAIDIARVSHPDVVVIDISMTGMSGVEAVPALREAGCAVVICSAFGSAAASAIRAGAAAVVDKADLGMLPGVLASLPGSAPA